MESNLVQYVHGHLMYFFLRLLNNCIDSCYSLIFLEFTTSIARVKLHETPLETALHHALLLYYSLKILHFSECVTVKGQYLFLA